MLASGTARGLYMVLRLDDLPWQIPCWADCEQTLLVGRRYRIANHCSNSFGDSARSADTRFIADSVGSSHAKTVTIAICSFSTPQPARDETEDAKKDRVNDVLERSPRSFTAAVCP